MATRLRDLKPDFAGRVNGVNVPAGQIGERVEVAWSSGSNESQNTYVNLTNFTLQPGIWTIYMESEFLAFNVSQGTGGPVQIQFGLGDTVSDTNFIFRQASYTPFASGSVSYVGPAVSMIAVSNLTSPKTYHINFYWSVVSTTTAGWVRRGNGRMLAIRTG